jgi:hypothetical protein
MSCTEKAAMKAFRWRYNVDSSVLYVVGDHSDRHHAEADLAVFGGTILEELDVDPDTVWFADDEDYDDKED